MNTLRTLVLDGDPISRKALMELLAEHPATRIIEDCSNALEAIPVLRDFKPDVFICEVETSGINGFSLLETIPLKHRPATIFISNLDHFGVRAFEVSAADYILKPVRKERLFQALERARIQVESRQNSGLLQAERSAGQLAIRTGRSVIFVKPDELDWVEAEGKYVRLHMGKEVLFLKMSISALEQELDHVRFARIHRSTIVNVDRVRRIQPWNHRRTYQVILQDGTCLVLSRKLALVNAKSQNSLRKDTAF